MGEIRKNVKRWPLELRHAIYKRGVEIYLAGESGGSSDLALRMAMEQKAGDKQRKLHQMDKERFEEYLESARPIQPTEKIVEKRVEVEVPAPVSVEVQRAMDFVVGFKELFRQCVVAPLAEEIRNAISAVQQPVPAAAPDFAAFAHTLEQLTARLEDAALVISSAPQAETAHPVPDYTPRERPEPQAPEVNGNRIEKIERKKVLIIGNLTTQSQEATKRFPHVDIRYLDGTRAFDRIEKVSQNVDCTFVLQDYVSHKVKSHIKGDSVMIRGGASRLFSMIADRYGPGGNGKFHH